MSVVIQFASILLMANLQFPQEFGDFAIQPSLNKAVGFFFIEFHKFVATIFP